MEMCASFSTEDLQALASLVAKCLSDLCGESPTEVTTHEIITHIAPAARRFPWWEKINRSHHKMQLSCCIEDVLAVTVILAEPQ